MLPLLRVLTLTAIACCQGAPRSATSAPPKCVQSPPLVRHFFIVRLCNQLGLLIFIGKDILEHVAQADGPSEFAVAIAQRTSLLALLLATGPFIAAQCPERSLEVGSLAGQFLADLIDSRQPFA